jgi:hypothetical protein
MPSTLVLPISASLDDLQNQLNKDVPTTLYAIDQNQDACVPAKWIDVCIVPLLRGRCAKRLKTKISPDIDCHIEGAVNRGQIVLGGSGTTLNLTMPVSAHVTAGGRGDIGKNIHVTADGTITAAVSVQANIDANWQPTATVNADYSWDHTIGVTVLGIRISFADKVDPKIHAAIDSFKQQLPSILAKLNLKEQANSAWVKGFATLPVANAPDVWVRFTPNAVGYNGYQIANRILRLNVMAAGLTETFVGKRPVDSPLQPLPPLQRALPNPGFNFVIPISADYQTLINIAKEQLKIGTSQTVNIPKIGVVKTTFRDIRLYQTTGNRLAIGVTLDAQAPSSLLNVKGTVWLIADILIENDRKIINVKDFEIYSQTNNLPADLLVSVVEFEPINQLLRSAIEYNFSKNYQAAMQQANAALTRQIADGFILVGKIDSIAADSVTAGPEALLVRMSAKGNLELRTGTLAK